MAALPQESVFYAHGSAGQEGPMSADDLVAAVASGRLGTDTLVWWPDAEGWVAFGSQPELAARLSASRATPVPSIPPPPGAPPAAAAAPAAEPDDGALQPAIGAPLAAPDELDRIFSGLVDESWRFHHLIENTTKVDEVFVGALITATVETGRMLIDLTSDGENHFLRFEDPEDRSRLSIAVTHLTRQVTQAKTMGQRASVVFAYGEPVKSIGKILDAVRQEHKSGYLGQSQPGVVTFDGDRESQYLYTQIPMYMDLDEYVSAGFEVDYRKLSSHVGATAHALRRFLHGKVETEEAEG